MKSAAERGHPIRVGIVVPPMWMEWPEIVTWFRAADEAEWDAGFVVDHFLSDLAGFEGDHGPTLEAWTLLGALAAATTRLRVGTYVTSVTHRHAGVLAKQAATLDHLSGGRAILGVGAGWHEREHAAYGIPFPGPKERVDLFAETMEALRRLEGSGRASFSGRFVTLDNAPFEPRPPQGHIPILVGSRGKRMIRLVARYGDLWDLPSKLDRLEELEERLLSACAAEGRNPDDIVWVHEDRDAGWEHRLEDRISELAPLGVSFFLVGVRTGQDPKSLEELASIVYQLRRPATGSA